jgi:methylglyoxal synthase
MDKRKRIVLIAHDRLKPALVEWARSHIDVLRQHELCATGTTGGRIEKELGLKVSRFLSGPMGGDQQVGSRIAERAIDMMIFFWDPLEPQPHDVDVKALLRIAVLYDIPVANNRASADFLISSPWMSESYETRPDRRIPSL